MSSKLRIDRWSREYLESGILILISIIIGGILLFYALQSLPHLSLLGGAKGYTITSPSEYEKAVSDSRPAAIMFSSDTCPVCQEMEPYWSKLARKQDLPIRFYILKLNKDTINIFMRNGVDETPTFIVFMDGKPVARHLGSFQGTNITRMMYQWAMSSTGLDTATLEIMRHACSGCHSLPRSLKAPDLTAWIYNSNDTIAKLIKNSSEEGVLPSQYVGGKDRLTNIILSMSPNLTTSEAEQAASLIDGIAASLEKGSVGEKVELKESGNSAGMLASAPAALVAGLITAFSPCVFPVLLAYLSLLSSRESKTQLGAGTSIKAAAATALGALAIGGAFLLLGSIATSINKILLSTAALTLIAAGILGALGVPTFMKISVSTKSGLLGFSFLYGLLAVQCSFPLVAGALLVIAGSGLTIGFIALVSFMVGLSTPVALAVWATGKESLLASLRRLAGEKAQKYSYALLGIMGTVLLLYSLNIIILG